VTAVILRIPLAIPSSAKSAKALASRVFEICVPRSSSKNESQTETKKVSFKENISFGIYRHTIQMK
jgi:hypothetical protein